MNLSLSAALILNALRANAENWESAPGWCDVYLDNARPRDCTPNVFRANLAVLAKAGVYKVVDGFAWGRVKMA